LAGEYGKKFSLKSLTRYASRPETGSEAERSRQAELACTERSHSVEAFVKSKIENHRVSGAVSRARERDKNEINHQSVRGNFMVEKKKPDPNPTLHRGHCGDHLRRATLRLKTYSGREANFRT